MTEPTGPELIDITPAARLDAATRDAAVRAAFDAHHGELYAFLRRSTRDPDAAEDLLQDTFLRLTREIDAGRTPEHLRGWLFRVATNLAISRGRRATTALGWLRRQRVDPEGGHVGSPESDVLGRERTAALESVLAILPHDARTALLLSADGFSGEEIAAAIGRTHAATRTLLTRTRLRVREELQRRETDR